MIAVVICMTHHSTSASCVWSMVVEQAWCCQCLVATSTCNKSQDIALSNFRIRTIWQDFLKNRMLWCCCGLIGNSQLLQTAWLDDMSTMSADWSFHKPLPAISCKSLLHTAYCMTGRFNHIDTVETQSADSQLANSADSIPEWQVYNASGLVISQASFSCSLDWCIDIWAAHQRFQVWSHVWAANQRSQVLPQ